MMNNNTPGRTFRRSTDEHPESPGPFHPGEPRQQQQYAPFNGSERHQQHYTPGDGGYQQDTGDMPPPTIRVTKYDAQLFGQEIHDKLQDLGPPRSRPPRDFTPKVRAVDEIFKEDEQSSANYASTIAEDDVLNVECSGGELVTIDSWADALLPESLMTNIRRAKYVKPRQIQRTAIPFILDRYDVTGHAETGSGKTGAYLIPIIAECIEAKQSGQFKSDTGYPYCIILTPTRELVRQCYEQAIKFAHQTGVTVAKAYGEYPTRKNVQEVNEGCDILVISPGRFKHFSDEGCIGFNKLRFLVFDEGDLLLTPFFMTDIRPILQLPSFPKGNVRQTLFFSATFTEEMLNNAKEFMRDEGFRAFVSNRKNTVNKKCTQEFFALEHTKKFSVLVDFLRNELHKVDNDVKKFPRTLVFCNTREYCEKLSYALSISGIASKPLSGMMAQDLREQAFDDFRSNQVQCLLVTDLCARGIDIKELDLVINYDLPDDYDIYIHRAGRVGRIRHGKCISYVSAERHGPLLLKIKQDMEASGQIVPPSLEEVLRSTEGVQFENQAADNLSVENVYKEPEESDYVFDVNKKAEKSIPDVSDVDNKVEEAVADLSLKDGQEDNKKSQVLETARDKEVAPSASPGEEKHSDVNEMDASSQPPPDPSTGSSEQMKPDAVKLDAAIEQPEVANEDSEDDW